MPTYNLIDCTNNSNLILSSSTVLSSGQTVSYNIIGREQAFCGVVENETSGTTDTIFITGFSSCCECYLSGTPYQSLLFIECITDEYFYVDISTFCTDYGDVPNFSQIWKFLNLETGEFRCGQFLGLSETTGVTFFSPVEIFENCYSCLRGTTTYSAGTEYTVCVICEDCCASGTTATTVNPPHPTWTRPDGNAVVLLDAVQLGGMFGLNS